MTTGRIAAAYDSMAFAILRQYARPIHSSLIGPTESTPKRHLYRFSHFWATVYTRTHQ